MQIKRRNFLNGAGLTVAALAIGSGRSGSWAAAIQEKSMEIRRLGSQPSRKGPEEWFTGSVRIDPLFQSHDPSRASASNVTFEPGARTAWHTHPF